MVTWAKRGRGAKFAEAQDAEEENGKKDLTFGVGRLAVGFFACRADEHQYCADATRETQILLANSVRRQRPIWIMVNWA